MKDLFNHQKSMVFGVKKIKRIHCRAFLKDQIPYHILLDTGAGADSPVHVYQEIDSIDQSVGKGRFRSWSTDLGLDTILHPASENLCCFQLSFRPNLGY